MAKECGKKLNNQRGSATVEAVVGFTAFLGTIFTLLGLINFCRAQMMVSYAVDTTAKELSQYAYFYKMSGLQKFDKALDENAEVGKNNINEVIGTVDTLYSSLVNATSDADDLADETENMLKRGEFDVQAVENAVGNVTNNIESIRQGAVGVANAVGDVANDPLLYMRSVVAVAGSGASSAVKRAVIVPLAKAFMSGHFGVDTKTANHNLEALGIKGGLDSMDFWLSSFFEDSEQSEIELVVIYKVELLKVFDWVVLEAKLSKVASCRAWLGGDDVTVLATNKNQPSLGTGENSSENGYEMDTPDNPGTNLGEDSPTEPDTNPTEPSGGSTEPSTEPGETVDITDSLWHKHNPEYGSAAESFRDKYMTDYHLDTESKNKEYQWQKPLEGHDVSVVYSYEARTTPDSYDMFYYAYHTETIKTLVDEGELPATTSIYVHVVYVPENMPEEEYQKMKDEALNASADFATWRAFYATDEERAKYGDIVVSVEIVRAGGNYDYSS